MPTTFSAFFGDAFNGMTVVFENLPHASDSAQDEIQFTMIANMYARLPSAGCGAAPIDITTEVGTLAPSNSGTTAPGTAYDTFEWALAWASLDNTDCGDICFDGVKAIAMPEIAWTSCTADVTWNVKWIDEVTTVGSELSYDLAPQSMFSNTEYDPIVTDQATDWNVSRVEASAPDNLCTEEWQIVMADGNMHTACVKFTAVVKRLWDTGTDAAASDIPLTKATYQFNAMAGFTTADIGGVNEAAHKWGGAVSGSGLEINLAWFDLTTIPGTTGAISLALSSALGVATLALLS